MKTASKRKSSGKLVQCRPSYKRYPKPPYSYQGMIVAAILMSEDKAATLTEIHQNMKQMFAFFQGRYQGWKDSVRHNLSHFRCFYQRTYVDKIKWKGQPWMVDLNAVGESAYSLQSSSMVCKQNPNVTLNYDSDLRIYLEKKFDIKWKDLSGEIFNTQQQMETLLDKCGDDVTRPIYVDVNHIPEEKCSMQSVCGTRDACSLLTPDSPMTYKFAPDGCPYSKIDGLQNPHENPLHLLGSVAATREYL